MTGQFSGFNRRSFLRIATTGAAAVAGGVVTVLASCRDTLTGVDDEDSGRALLRQPGTALASTLTLTAAPGAASIGDAAAHGAWLFNGELPGPTIRARRGEAARIRLLNALPEPTIVHWHGLLVPESADGHPRQAISPGEQYDYAFPVVQRAGTFWYHPHAHHRTAGQIHRGLAGFFLVTDDEEEALPLPRGEREVLLMLQDRRFDTPNPLSYAASSVDHVVGMLGDVPFGNGIRLPRIDVSADRYRVRVLNASHARVYRLALSTGAPLTVIGNDGGLLPAAVTVDSVYLGVGERIDVLIDFSSVAVGERVMLVSQPFSAQVVAGEAFPQGISMDLLEIRVTAPRTAHDPALPAILSSVPEPSIGDAVATRAFIFSSTQQGEMHRINGSSFDMNRVDERIPLGQTERWRFTNDSAIPHPVHLHGTHFRVLSRTGGRSIVYGYEGGWKDTVLLMPLETVDVLVRFDNYLGVFPLHCHNLQHEDMGMMLNVEVV
jgi:FtsP/CotA-like multicopper oxidase with cupredoxin domain